MNDLPDFINCTVKGHQRNPAIIGEISYAFIFMFYTLFLMCSNVKFTKGIPVSIFFHSSLEICNTLSQSRDNDQIHASPL